MTLAASPVGGQLLPAWGNVLGFTPFQGVLPSPGVQPSVQQQSLLDVARQDLKRINWVDDTTHSGSFGTSGSNVVAQSFTLSATVVWDIRNPPNFLIDGGNLASPQDIDLGYQFWVYMGSPLNYPNDVNQYYWFCPSCKGNALSVIQDAAARKKVRAEIEIISNAPLFALGSTINDFTKYNQYIAHCMTRNWVW